MNNLTNSEVQTPVSDTRPEPAPQLRALDRLVGEWTYPGGGGDASTMTRR